MLTLTINQVDIGRSPWIEYRAMRDTVLRMLHQKQCVSGEELGKELSISRTAVWKHIEDLRRKGYEINSSPRLGYSLIKTPDLLIPEEIGLHLETRCFGKEILYFEEIGSTQDEARQLASKGAEEGLIVVAEKQSLGRGRLGRIWSSPSGMGIYLSIVLRPDLKPHDAIQIPLVAGVAVCQAIDSTTRLKPRIKWPNDIIAGGKKLGGILTEMSAEVDRIDFIILGIGINVNTPRELFPEELSGVATSLVEETGQHITRVQLVQSLLWELEQLYDEFKASGFGPARERWKLLNNTIGSRVQISGGEELTGEAIDIDPNGALIVREENGNKRRIVAGDVSLRGTM